MLVMVVCWCKRIRACAVAVVVKMHVTTGPERDKIFFSFCYLHWEDFPPSVISIGVKQKGRSPSCASPPHQHASGYK